jgi:broad-specificity NMP kinase
MGAPRRQLPNILVTGTPGTGKSTTCEQIAEATGLKYLNIGELVREQDLHCGWDKDFQCHIIDEDKVRARLPADGSCALNRQEVISTAAQFMLLDAATRDHSEIRGSFSHCCGRSQNSSCSTPQSSL